MLEPFDRLVIGYMKVLNLTFKIIPEPVLSIESGHVVHVLGDDMLAARCLVLNSYPISSPYI